MVKIAIVVLVIAGVFAVNNQLVSASIGTIDGKLSPCPSTPNCVSSGQNNGSSAIDPLPLVSADVLSLIEGYLSSHYRAQVMSRKSHYLHVVVSTALFRFKDDLEFLVDEEKGVVDVRSSSRFGYWDFGVNRSRIENIREFLEEKTGSSR